MDIALQRLQNQRLLGDKFATPEEAVSWLGAVQSQDYHGAKWGVGQRLKSATDADLDRAFNEGRILRTHVLRPTWHFVAPGDIAWMLALTAPRVHAASAYYYRKTELTPGVLSKCEEVIRESLTGGQFLTRNELGERFAKEGIEAKSLRLGYIVGYWELEGLICSGPLRGKQFTYALMEERAPQAKRFDPEDALAELAQRYFTSHGPATVHDFCNWSSLTVADGKKAVEANRGGLHEVVVEGKSYWMADLDPVAKPKQPVVHLLPNYDEHLIAYKDYEPTFDPDVYAKLEPNDYRMLAHLITQNGKVVGGWRRSSSAKKVGIQVSWLDGVGRVDLEPAVEAFRAFLGVPVEVT